MAMLLQTATGLRGGVKISQVLPYRSWTHGRVGRKLASRCWLCGDAEELVGSKWSHHWTICLNLSHSRLVGRKGICSQFGCRKWVHHKLVGQKARCHWRLVCKSSLQNKGPGSEPLAGR